MRRGRSRWGQRWSHAGYLFERSAKSIESGVIYGRVLRLARLPERSIFAVNNYGARSDQIMCKLESDAGEHLPLCLIDLNMLLRIGI